MSGNDLPILCYWDIRGVSHSVRIRSSEECLGLP